MASLRRSTVMPSDSATSRFLYAIIKQLDHKSIDWNTVASELDITNGHAARMRFSRFKQHMEGIPPAPRKPRSESRPHKKAKVEKGVKREPKQAKEKQETVKSEPVDFGSLPTASETEVPGLNTELFIKPEPSAELFVNHETFIKPEPVIKDEPMDEEPDREVGNDPPSAFANMSFSKLTASPREKPAEQAFFTADAPATADVVDRVPSFAANMETHLVVKQEPSESI